MIEYKSKKARSVFPVHINAPVEKVFPLVSPIGEYRWIPGWKCNLIHCPNDIIAQGTIFSEISSAPFLIGRSNGETTWTVVMHDPENFKIHFRLDNEISSSLYKIELENNNEGGTVGRLDLTYNGINKKGVFRITPLYDFKKGRSVNVGATNFMKIATLRTSGRMEFFFKKEAKRQFQKIKR